MDLIQTELDALRDKYKDAHSSANWDQSSTLVFREIRQRGAISLNGGHLSVDIRINFDSVTNLLSGDGEGYKDVLKLTWEGDPGSSSCTSTCLLCVKDHGEETSTVIINKLLKDNFTTLRQFVGMLFKEYRSRLMTLSIAPLRFDIVHMGFEEFEYMQSNINVFGKQFRNMFSENMPSDLTFNLQLQTDGAVGRDSSMYNLTHSEECDELSLPSRRPSPVEVNGRIRAVLKKNTDVQMESIAVTELVQLERKLQIEQNIIYAHFNERKTHNEKMMASVKLLLNHHRKMKTVKQLQEAPYGCKPKSRDAGDGTETQLAMTCERTTFSISSSQLSKHDQSDRETRVPQTLTTQLPVKEQSNNRLDLETDSEQHKSAAKAIDKNYFPGRSSKNSSLKKTGQKSKQNVHFKDENKNYSKVKTVHDKNESNLSRAVGMDTVLTFHTSTISSSRYDDSRLQEMKQIALDYIEGIEEVASIHEIEENIGIVAAGKSSWIKHRPTNDYTFMREIIDEFHECRRASLSEVLQESLDFMTAEVQVHKVSGSYEIGPRLIIISDHNVNHHGDPQDLMQERDRLINVFQRLSQETSLHESMVWIPSGKADRGFLQAMARVNHGTYVEKRDVKRLCKYQQIQLATGNILTFMKQQGGFLTGDINKDVNFLLGCYASKLDEEDKKLIERAVKETVTKGRHGDTDDSFLHTERPQLPPLGTRVVRGEDWKWDNQDSEGPGTIIGHLDELHVVVEWDTGYTARYRYGALDAYDLKVVTDQPRLNVTGFNISVGCEVQRGPDWDDEHGNEDGGPGGTGVVIRSRGDGIIKVRWRSNGYIGTYKWGLEGKLELTLRDPVEILEEATQATDAASKPQLSKNDQEYDPLKSSGNMTNTRPQVEKKLTHTPSVTKHNAKTALPHSEAAAKYMPKETCDNVKNDLVKNSSQALVREDQWIWQWQDDMGNWRTYSSENIQKIESCFLRRPVGSCLILRENQGHRVLFKEMEEKCILDNRKRRVQRKKSTNDI